MKFYYILATLFTTVVVIATACKKDTSNNQLNPARKVQFVLYTSKDFSGNNDSIFFSVAIKKLSGTSLWDSTLAPMRLQEIPTEANKIVIEKLVPNNDTATLKVGFYYTLKNVGNAWYIDSFKTGNTFKLLEFDFR